MNPNPNLLVVLGFFYCLGVLIGGAHLGLVLLTVTLGISLVVSTLHGAYVREQARQELERMQKEPNWASPPKVVPDPADTA